MNKEKIRCPLPDTNIHVPFPVKAIYIILGNMAEMHIHILICKCSKFLLKSKLCVDNETILVAMFPLYHIFTWKLTLYIVF